VQTHLVNDWRVDQLLTDRALQAFHDALYKVLPNLVVQNQRHWLSELLNLLKLGMVHLVALNFFSLFLVVVAELQVLDLKTLV
jgi:hypothetical protein